MTLKIETGDVFNAIMDRDVMFVHGVNMQKKMASGVAGIVRKLYPHAYDAYMEVGKKDDLHLGQVIIVPPPVAGQPTIINLVSQEYYGRDGKIYADYDAIIIGCQAIAKYAKGNEIFLPLIGGGLGGLDAKRLIAIYQEVFREVDATLYLKDE